MSGIRSARNRLSKKLISDGLWSFVGSFGSLIAGTVALRITTRIVAANAYGTASLVLGLISLFNALVIGPLITALGRCYFDYTPGGQGPWFLFTARRIVATAIGLMIGCYLALTIFQFKFGSRLYIELAVPAILLLIGQTLQAALAMQMEAERRQRRLAQFNISQRLAYPFILFVLLGSRLPRAYSLLLSQAVSTLAAVFAFVLLFERNSPRIDREENAHEFVPLLRNLFKLGSSVGAGYLAIWFVTTSDRYLIGRFGTLTEVGIYSANYSLWSIPYLALNGWLEVLTRPITYGRAARADWNGVWNTLLTRAAVGLSLSAAGTAVLFLLRQRISSLMLGSHYLPNGNLMLLIGLGHCAYVLGYSVLPMFLAAKRPASIVQATAAAALFNVALNMVVIPRYGSLGAAASTLTSYLLWAGILAHKASHLVGALRKKDSLTSRLQPKSEFPSVESAPSA